jgi:hypothetical protein
VHSITAPPFLVRPCIHRRAFLFSFGRCISSPRRILFVRPAHPTVVPLSLRLPVHSPPIHQFGVASFAGAFAADPPIWCCFVCRRIRRRSTDLVLLRLPAHSPPIHQFGAVPFGRRIPRRAATDLVLSHFGRRIPSPRHHCLSRLAHPIAYLLRLALIAPEQAAYCADSAKANPGYSLLLLIVAF